MDPHLIVTGLLVVVLPVCMIIIVLSDRATVRSNDDLREEIREVRAELNELRTGEEMHR